MILFRRPTIQVNFVPLGKLRVWMADSLLIPKKLWLIKERRFMAIREIFKSGTSLFGLADQYKEAGIELVENTAEEIASVFIEMEERLNGT